MTYGDFISHLASISWQQIVMNFNKFPCPLSCVPCLIATVAFQYFLTLLGHSQLFIEYYNSPLTNLPHRNIFNIFYDPKTNLNFDFFFHKIYNSLEKGIFMKKCWYVHTFFPFLPPFFFDNTQNTQKQNTQNIFRLNGDGCKISKSSKFSPFFFSSFYHFFS